MEICKVYVPIGALGAGIDEDDITRAMSKNPSVIAADAGSTDSGPYYLGNSKTKYARKSLKNDLKLMITHSRENKIPMIIGSCGTCGTDDGVNMYAEICEEILLEEGLSGKIAKIYSQQPTQLMKQRFEEGKIRPLNGAPTITKETFDSCSNIVALAGVEPFMEALNQGADIILCGRATDTAVIAAYPILHGADVAISWHIAKLLECGALCATQPTNGGVMATFEEDSAIVEATGKGNSCTVYSVSSHLLYENTDPILLIEPGVAVDMSNSTYEQLERGRVRVSGTTYKEMPYTMKLEGSRHAGYQTITLVGVRDRKIMANLNLWLEKVENFAVSRMKKSGFDLEGVSYLMRPYGYNATHGGEVPKGYLPDEVGILLTVTAPTQEHATQIAKAFNPALLHCPLEENMPMPSFAFPFSPAEIERGAVYEFTLNHVVETLNPLELVRFEYLEKGGK